MTLRLLSIKMGDVADDRVFEDKAQLMSATADVAERARVHLPAEFPEQRRDRS
jgi:hypothetical protein